MKKLYCFLLTILLYAGAKSQTYSGQLMAGGNLTFRSEKHQTISSEYSINIFTLSPSAGVFVVNNLAAGFRLDYTRYRSKSSLIEQRSVIQIFSYSPFIRYYFLRPSNKIMFLWMAVIILSRNLAHWATKNPAHRVTVSLFQEDRQYLLQKVLLSNLHLAIKI